jgi:hypothetical protein
MSKGIILSAVVAIIAIPIFVAREKDPKAGLKKAVWYTIVFNIIYLLALRFVVHI